MREATAHASLPVKLPGLGDVSPGDVLPATVMDEWVQIHRPPRHSAWYRPEQLASRGLTIKDEEGTRT